VLYYKFYSFLYFYTHKKKAVLSGVEYMVIREHESGSKCICTSKLFDNTPVTTYMAQQVCVTGTVWRYNTCITPHTCKLSSLISKETTFYFLYSMNINVFFLTSLRVCVLSSSSSSSSVSLKDTPISLKEQKKETHE